MPHLFSLELLGWEAWARWDVVGMDSSTSFVASNRGLFPPEPAPWASRPVRFGPHFLEAQPVAQINAQNPSRSIDSRSWGRHLNPSKTGASSLQRCVRYKAGPVQAGLAPFFLHDVFRQTVVSLRHWGDSIGSGCRLGLFQDAALRPRDGGALGKVGCVTAQWSHMVLSTSEGALPLWTLKPN